MAAPPCRAISLVRIGGEQPDVVRVGEDELEISAAAVVAELAGQYSSVALVAVEARHAALGDALDVPFGAGIEQGLVETVTVLEPVATKGLEFDAVVVVEPAEIVAATDRGASVLYVVLTRAVQRLAIRHAQPLPEPLR